MGRALDEVTTTEKTCSRRHAVKNRSSMIAGKLDTNTLLSILRSYKGISSTSPIGNTNAREISNKRDIGTRNSTASEHARSALHEHTFG